MSVTMAKADGVTVFTLTSDPNSACPPLCQILKGLCCSPVCCSVSQPLRRLQGTSQSVLGALQIMIGALHIGLGAILCSGGGLLTFGMQYIGYPFWLGALFIFFGIMCILSEKFPSPCLVITNVILNLEGVGFAITSIVLYSTSTGNYDDYSDNYFWRDNRLPMMVRSINIVLIILSHLELCIVVSVVVLGIKALKKRGSGETKETENPEFYKPLLKDVPSNPAV
ncbi:membrane-spanning 4-domains subfamily A member 8-like [Sphaeramia orbicularis]|uniref:membrane-spanning 4-domains subfamily A member 8-like n=1 Tax=Sphaeramia orbicularis TaxID=375764 RepID=UPI00117D4571|nr:membrane-spanning 4-domains subfamily A member 8-like [Sphaeramia orbicularis]